MLSKNKIKRLIGLQSKKQRLAQGCFVVEGKKLFEAATRSDQEILEIFGTEEFLQFQDLQANDEEVHACTAEELKRASSMSSNNTVIAVVRRKEEALLPAWKNDFSLVLDGINDPGNLGTIIRTAAWFGIQRIICSSDCVDCYNPKVVQATMGAIFAMNIHYTDLEPLVKEASQSANFPIFGAFLDGENPSVLNGLEKGFLILGSESHGIRPQLETLISQKVCIPGAENTKEESLNVAVANAILLHEISK